MCFYKAIEQSMFKHISSENAPLVLILQSYSQIFIVLKHTRRTAQGKFALRVASWVPVSGRKFNEEFMGIVNNDRVAGAEIFPPLANKQN